MGVGRYGTHGLALGGVGILDVLCLVDDGYSPRELLQFGDIGAKDAIGGEEDVGIPSGRTAGHTFSREGLQGALVTMIGEDGELRGEAMELGLPVGDEAGGDNDERTFLVEHPLVLHTLKQSNDLKRFTETHIVGNDTSKANAHVTVHPRITPLLIGTQGGMDVGRHGDFSLCAQLAYQLVYLVGQLHASPTIALGQSGLQHLCR